MRPTMTHRWTERPLANTYLCLATVGGPALERLVGAPTGTGHLLEHLLFRRVESEPADSPLRGARLGMFTSRETMQVDVVCAPEAAAGIVALLERWWLDFQITAALVREEFPVIREELAERRFELMPQLWPLVFDRYSPGSWAANPISGPVDDLLDISVEELRDWQGAAVGLGAHLSAVGPHNPWAGDSRYTEPAPTDGVRLPDLPWTSYDASPAPRSTPEAERVIVCAAREVPGRRSPHVAAGYCFNGALDRGLNVEIQQELKRRHAVRSIEYRQEFLAERGVVVAVTECRGDVAAEILPLLEQSFDVLRLETDGVPLATAGAGYLGACLDEPKSFAQIDARASLLAADSGAEALTAMRDAPADETRALVEKHVAPTGPSIIVKRR
ncbi:peptidase M16 family protein [Micromonospora sagamiensis]|uniref:Putative Zn-dependent peptidase n=1 Tax=Micromonospora sagamiensis TaxID=47875 RepID=A0A562WPW0_9ACTN|nr:insulinase family protein [Micromonospora sagamiensis]TWJ32212.1 putative Zn-dependent peptidase [Micromonospora sagamiensis]BCL14730.1 hypothetical protein GCM10017556_24690 [Micromonospora sagamiensis]